MADEPDPDPPAPPGREHDAYQAFFDDRTAERDFAATVGDDSSPGPGEPVTEITPQLARLSLSGDELRQRMTVGSADGQVVVVADVAGRLLELNVSPDAVRGLHSRSLSQLIAETVNAARGQAEQAAMEAAEQTPVAEEAEGT